jgi:NADH-quinone oxidoreductase subunit L/multicomponent Na+:H+ antiporter subunit D
MTAFGVASLGMAGIPLLAGFVSKWYLLVGSFEAGYAVFAFALLLSGVLNIAYFWPIVYQAFFETPEESDEKPLVDAELGGHWGGVPDHYTPRITMADGGEDVEDGHVDHGGEGGWTRVGWRGGEASPFVLVPILGVCACAVALGVAPVRVYFFRVVRLVVENVTGVVV